MNKYELTKKEVFELITSNSGHIPYHIGPRIPEEITDMTPYDDFYEEGMALLHCVFRLIATTFKMDPDKLINYMNDTKSVLTTRKYFRGGYYTEVKLVSELPQELTDRTLYLYRTLQDNEPILKIHASHLKEPITLHPDFNQDKYVELTSVYPEEFAAFFRGDLNEMSIKENPENERLIEKIASICGCSVNSLGIPEHSDYGILTLVVSDQLGLQVQKKGSDTWVSAPCEEKGQPSLYKCR